MGELDMPRSRLLGMIASRFMMAFLLMAAAFFLPAWTLSYWQAWLYLMLLFVPMVGVLVYLYQHNPDLLVRRMRFQEKETQQKWIVGLAWVPFLLAFVLPGFDVRLGWSQVPTWLVILGDALVLAGYAVVFLTFRENRYASRIVEVEKEQKVISTGPYALVRHPMYIGSILLYVFSPLALGSYWGMLPALIIIPILAARIRNEETVLEKDLPGYKAYKRKTRFRLLPGVW